MLTNIMNLNAGRKEIVKIIFSLFKECNSDVAYKLEGFNITCEGSCQKSYPTTFCFDPKSKEKTIKF